MGRTVIVLSKKEAAERDKISLRHLERLIANVEGPPLVRLGPRPADMPTLRDGSGGRASVNAPLLAKLLAR